MFEKMPKVEVTSSKKILSILILILFFPAVIFTLPYYLIFTKIKVENVFKLLFSSFISLLYIGLFLILLFHAQPNLIKISNANLFLYNPSSQSKILNPKVSIPAKKDSYPDGIYFVTRVIDGDTIELSDGTKVRYIGMNAPEISKKTECYGEKAKQKNINLVLNKKVRLEKDISEKDKYDRLLRYVYIDKVFVNKTLVEEGYANAATYPPDVKFQDLFLTVQKQAQQKNIGLWKDCKK